MKKEIDDYFSFPGISQVTHSEHGNITERYASFYCLLFNSKETGQKYGFLFGIHKERGMSILGAFPYSFVQGGFELAKESEALLEGLLSNPGSFENVNVVSSV
ncbi:MAG: hypothetical protein ACTSU5_05475 [Promethearchaeota archaeon]